MANKSSAVDDGQWSKMSGGTAAAAGGFMLFGVRLMEGSFRKSASMNNLALYDQPQESNNDVIVTAGYASDDVVHPSGRSRERKRGVPWSEEEHKLFLFGLKKAGKGDWRGISRNFVKTRTPTQVASHAQKYFLRQNNHNRRRRRSSLFDITADLVFRGSEQMNEGNSAQPPIIQPKKLSITSDNSMENLNLGQLNQLNNSPKPIRPIPILPLPPTSKLANLDLNKTNNTTTTTTTPSLSLNLSISSQSVSPPPFGQQPPPARQVSTFQALPAGGDSIISVA